MALEYEEIDLGQVDGINGTNGKEVELQLTATHIQWRYKGASTWINLVALSTITGPQGLQGIAGKKLMIQVSGGFIQYKYESDTTWVNLIALSSITGATGPVGPALSFKVGTVTTLPAGSTATVTATVANNLITLNLGIPQGIAGVAGKDGNAKIANNLTTTDVTYALSAPQGKALKEITDDIIAGRKTVPWNGVGGKPTTFAPILGETVSTAYSGASGKALSDKVNDILSENCRSITATIINQQVNSSNDVSIIFNAYLLATNKKDVDTSLAEIMPSGDILVKKSGRYMIIGEFNYVMHSGTAHGVLTVCNVNGRRLCQTASGAHWSNLIGGTICATCIFQAGDIIHVGENTHNDICDIGRAVLEVVYLGGVE